MSSNTTTPPCEMCHKHPAISFAYFDDHQPGRRWLFSCPCSDEKQDCSVPIRDFLASSSAAVDSLLELHKKPWIDWREFMAMMERFRTAEHRLHKATVRP